MRFTIFNNPNIGPVRAKPHRMAFGAVLHALLPVLLSLLLASQAWAGEADEEDDAKSVFLVATDNLRGSSFEQTVILMTHAGGRGGTTGLAINRPSNIPLKEAFPKITRLRNSTDMLYLGGPVSSQSVFVLLRTRQPKKGMMQLIGDVYFVPGHRILAQPIEGDSRAYAGYVGWAPGQLQAEIDRGDWQVIRSAPDIIFEKDTSSLWQQLSKSWSGNWI